MNCNRSWCTVVESSHNTCVLWVEGTLFLSCGTCGQKFSHARLHSWGDRPVASDWNDCMQGDINRDLVAAKTAYGEAAYDLVASAIQERGTGSITGEAEMPTLEGNR